MATTKGGTTRVRFTQNTNRSMVKYFAGQEYDVSPSVLAWMKSKLADTDYEIVRGSSKPAAEPREMKPPKNHSRTASSKKAKAKAKAAEE